VRKNTKVFKKGMLSLDFFGLSLDLVWTKSGLGGGGLQKRSIAASAEGPGLKPVGSIDRIQGDKSPCSLRKARTRVILQLVPPPAVIA